MEEVVKSVLDKISSYNIFNNLFPGIVFCYIVDQTTRFTFIRSGWENVVMYYFVGMLISRVGSLTVEKWLKALKIKNKKTKLKEAYLKFAPYEQYVEASQNDPLIVTLNETNNVYRTIISVLALAMAAKIYDWLFYDCVKQMGMVGQNLLCIAGGFLIILIFVHSYKKQTDYIRKRVEVYSNSRKLK